MGKKKELKKQKKSKKKIVKDFFRDFLRPIFPVRIKEMTQADAYSRGCCDDLYD